MDPNTFVGLTTYGPLGFAVIALAYALVTVYKQAKATEAAHLQHVQDLHTKHNAALEALHAEHRKREQEWYKQQADVWRQLVEETNNSQETNNELLGQLTQVLGQLTKPETTPSAGPRRGRG